MTANQKSMLAAESGSGMVYTVELVRNGFVIEREVRRNIMPTEGCNHVTSVVTKGGTQVPTWYIGLFEGNYTPQASDTAANFAAAATECTAYAPATRVEFVEGAVAAGATDNSASRAEFTMTAAKTIYGAFLVSAQAKGAVTGVLLSAARFAAPKDVQVDDVLRVTASYATVSA